MLNIQGGSEQNCHSRKSGTKAHRPLNARKAARRVSEANLQGIWHQRFTGPRFRREDLFSCSLNEYDMRSSHVINWTGSRRRILKVAI